MSVPVFATRGPDLPERPSGAMPAGRKRTRFGAWNSSLRSQCRLHHRARIRDVVHIACIPAAARIATDRPALAIVVEGAGMLGPDGAVVLVRAQFLHHAEHVHLAGVNEDLGVLLVWFAHDHVPEMDVVDALAAREVTANLDGTFS